jgi:hypothetical protein
MMTFPHTSSDHSLTSSVGFVFPTPSTVFGRYPTVMGFCLPCNLRSPARC